MVEEKKINAWPFEEAAKLVKRFEKSPPAKGFALFETGYGPSGLPHIGTFMEVFRTTLVRHAFQKLSNIPTRLFCVSDDMDGLRKVPDNIPNREMVTEHLGKPLVDIPDPFDEKESYGAYMNAKLCGFLDHYGFDYEFVSSAANYKKGVYDEKLLEALKNYDKIMELMLPTLGEERQKTYSPFLPISPKTGRVLQVPVLKRDLEKGTITFNDEGGEKTTVPVTGGHCKLQWKPDFGMRWAALQVDFEMYGKEHQPSAPLYNSICRALGGTLPEQYVYELFLDEDGQKISKSKGNGISMEDWLRYANPESLSYYMYQSPRKAKRLHFDVIPKSVDEYYAFLTKYKAQTEAERMENPVWHIHGGNPPDVNLPVSFALLLNLVGASNSHDQGVLWGFISRYRPGLTANTAPELDKLVGYAINYYEDFIKPNKKFRLAGEKEKIALGELASRLEKLPKDATAEIIQNEIYAVGKESGFEDLRGWFQALYEILLGQSQGPRFGSFVQLYGIDNTLALIKKAVSGESLAA